LKTQIPHICLIFFIFGITAGFVSLIIITLLPSNLSSNETVASIALLAIIEEVVKFSILYFIYSTQFSLKFKVVLNLLIFPIFLGLGFSFFELSMIYFQQETLPLVASFPIFVHIFSAIFLMNAVNTFFKGKSKFKMTMWILLAVSVHICYNVIIVKII